MSFINEIDNSEKIKNVESLIEKVYFQNTLPWVIGYSGGKDSTCTTQLIINTLIKLKCQGREVKKHVFIITSDTLVENPMLVDTIALTKNKINELAKRYDLPISAHIIKPNYDNTFWSNLIGRGYPCPNQTFRWCTDRMKINPTNQFITSIVDKYGEVIMVLGVRDGESNSRDRVLDTHTIEGRDLMRHTTMANAYVFAPIRSFTIDDVWNYLLNNESPWGSDNHDLFNLYNDSNEECPLMIDDATKKQGSCGNSRFGCWVCTVVSRDKSLSSFINKGEEWLIPLLHFRNWLYDIRDKDEMRMRRRNDGSIYFTQIQKNKDMLIIPQKGNRPKITIKKNNEKWIDNNEEEWHLFDSANAEIDAKNYIIRNNVCLDDGSNPHILIKNFMDEYCQIGVGPFTHKASLEILNRLFLLQKEIGDRCELFKIAELVEIKKIWFKQGYWDTSIEDLYFNVFNERINLIDEEASMIFSNDDLSMLESMSKDYEIDSNVIKNILFLEKENIGYNNRTSVQKNLKKIMNKEFINITIKEDQYEN